MVKWTNLGIKTYKEDPSDAEVPSHKLLVRSGLIKKLSSGIYTYSPLFLRALRKLEGIVREELDSVGMAELLMPMVQPKQLWVESKRWGYPDMQTFTNKNNNEFCLGPTHEEVITDYVRNDITSYKELPVMYYQVQNKYRDEIRPRFGLMRGREFLMKDAYSFDEDQEAAHKSYYLTRDAYVKIFDRLGLEYRIVKADAGAIGGSLTEEFQVLASVGEDELLVSDGSDYAANIEICPRNFSVDVPKSVSVEVAKEEISTPNLRTIEDLSKALNMPEEELVKTMFFEGEYPNGKLVKFTVLLRGCDQVNAIKIKNNLGFAAEPRMLTDVEVKELVGASPGSCGPVGVETNVYMDQFLKDYKSMVVGANKDDFHLKGVSPGRDFQIKEIFDLTSAQEGDVSPDGKGVLKSIRGVEVGHIFYLGTKYSKSMKAQFLDSKGKAQFFEMGCYGLGVSRTLQAAVEQSHDENGIIWPKALSPFDVHVCLLDSNDEIDEYLSKTVKELEASGLTVFLDNRKERPGVKFKDADLLGFPIRLTIGAKGFAAGNVDICIRSKGEKTDCALTDAGKRIKEYYESI
ncbi:MAG: proline--tRNA ligase [Bdellovibrionales bacterium]